MAKTPSYPVPALEKGLDIIETLAAAAVPLSLAEMAGRLERSSSELFRMLNCLEVRGYVTRDPVSSKYALTLKLYSLAHSHSVTNRLLRAARVPMQDLTEKLRESVHLSVLDRDRLLVVAQQESPERVRLSIEVGGLFDPLHTASGRLLVGHLDAEAQAVLLASSETWQGMSARQRAALAETFANVRKRGLSDAESETIEGVRDVAVLVGDPASGVVAALAITRLLKRGFREEETGLVAAMRETAASIGKALGLGRLAA